jgi:hypothetical protein
MKKFRWRTVEEGIIEVAHNKRKGRRLKVVTDKSRFNCGLCCLNGNPNYCREWAIINKKYNLCLMIDPSGFTYFQRLDEN